MRWDDLQWERGYNNWRAYGQSKLANLLFCFELQRRATAAGTALRASRRTWLRRYQPPVRRAEPRLRARVHGARQQADRAERRDGSAADAVRGDGARRARRLVHRPRRVHGEPRPPARSSPPRAGRTTSSAWLRLWETSEKLTGVHYEFPAIGGGLTSLREDGPAALEWAASYLERVGELPVLAQVKPGEIRARSAANRAGAAASRSRPSCATSTRCCCPGSRTGSTRATSPTSRPAPRSRRSSPSCSRRR